MKLSLTQVYAVLIFGLFSMRSASADTDPASVIRALTQFLPAQHQGGQYKGTTLDKKDCVVEISDAFQGLSFTAWYASDVHSDGTLANEYQFQLDGGNIHFVHVDEFDSTPTSVHAKITTSPQEGEGSTSHKSIQLERNSKGLIVTIWEKTGFFSSQQIQCQIGSN